MPHQMYTLDTHMKNGNKPHPRYPSLPMSAFKHFRGQGAWMRNEIAIMDGRKAFTPDQTTAKGPPNLGPIGNSVVKSCL